MTSRTGRDSALDFARALALVGMVMGHTLHAVLTDEARSTGFVAIYWRTRALTGPLFLLLAGWVLVLSLRRMSARGPLFSPSLLLRLGGLLVVGSVLNWPCGEGELLLHGDRDSWTRLVAFGPLHCVAIASCVAIVVMRLVPRDLVRAVLFGALAILAAGASSAVAPTSGTFAQLLAGGHQQYPLLPWSGFFFAGCTVPFVLPALDTPYRRRALLLGSLALVAISGQIDPLEFTPELFSNFVVRIGLAGVIVAAIQFLPRAVTTLGAPLGQMSLWVYAIHLPLVYGFHEWSGLSGNIGRSLSSGEGFAVAACVLVFSVTLAFMSRRLVRQFWAMAVPPRSVSDSPTA